MNLCKFQIQVQQQKTPRRQNENGDLLNDHPTNNNKRGINIKPKYQAIARNLLRKNSPTWGKFIGDTKGILILPGSCNGRTNSNRRKQF